ncbi:hypothetical protein BDY21DRAFT_200656 [Lineolata rhizophorae]|uniref:Uncharacterized protein n=1 Tax=Lineolata rhizophorae TaxID=578093 RepID=A0A6A6P4X7_9PEZI|nr:hypothetical protein BDY21DRAFT_200656 [Lineolata rhizophorae]
MGRDGARVSGSTAGSLTGGGKMRVKRETWKKEGIFGRAHRADFLFSRRSTQSEAHRPHGRDAVEAGFVEASNRGVGFPGGSRTLRREETAVERRQRGGGGASLRQGSGQMLERGSRIRSWAGAAAAGGRRWMGGRTVMPRRGSAASVLAR